MLCIFVFLFEVKIRYVGKGGKLFGFLSFVDKDFVSESV